MQRVLDYDSFFCDVCRLYVYEETSGDPARGLPAKTRVEALPDGWRCPWCGAGKTKLRACTFVDDYLDSDGNGNEVVRKKTSSNLSARNELAAQESQKPHKNRRR